MVQNFVPMHTTPYFMQKCNLNLHKQFPKKLDTDTLATWNFVRKFELKFVPIFVNACLIIIDFFYKIVDKLYVKVVRIINYDYLS
jgi:hypothetical protein